MTQNGLPEENLISQEHIDGVNKVVEISDRIYNLSKILADPSEVQSSLLNLAPSFASYSWKDSPTAFQTSIRSLETKYLNLANQVELLSSTNINLISSNSEIPVTIRNHAEQPITITVGLKAISSKILTSEDQVIEIAAQSTGSVQIPVTAIGSGNAEVQLEVKTSDGFVIQSSPTFTVRVRADWESVGTVIASLLLVLLLGGGIWRTIHRGRSKNRLTKEEITDIQTQTGEMQIVPEKGES